nr:MAG TPA: hypothetical protein [Caudoviricetes sp.]
MFPRAVHTDASMLAPPHRPGPLSQPFGASALTG